MVFDRCPAHAPSLRDTAPPRRATPAIRRLVLFALVVLSTLAVPAPGLQRGVAGDGETIGESKRGSTAARGHAPWRMSLSPVEGRLLPASRSAAELTGGQPNQHDWGRAQVVTDLGGRDALNYIGGREAGDAAFREARQRAAAALRDRGFKPTSIARVARIYVPMVVVISCWGNLFAGYLSATQYHFQNCWLDEQERINCMNP